MTQTAKNKKSPECPKCGSKATVKYRDSYIKMYEDNKRQGLIKRIPRKELAKMKDFVCTQCNKKFNRPKPKKEI